MTKFFLLINPHIMNTIKSSILLLLPPHRRRCGKTTCYCKILLPSQPQYGREESNESVEDKDKTFEGC